MITRYKKIIVGRRLVCNSGGHCIATLLRKPDRTSSSDPCRRVEFSRVHVRKLQSTTVKEKTLSRRSLSAVAKGRPPVSFTKWEDLQRWAPRPSSCHYGVFGFRPVVVAKKTRVCHYSLTLVFKSRSLHSLTCSFENQKFEGRGVVIGSPLR